MQSTPAVLRYVGDYELLDPIASGGMGAVYRARQRSLGRLVALKLIHAHLAQRPQAVERFRREARLAAQLAHPHIVPIHEIGEDQGTVFYAMELVEGEDLAHVLERGPLAAADAAELVANLARAVQYAHEHGVLHRDLKPANVLIDPLRVPRITDFGLARAMGEQGLTETGDVLGTPAYMAPEQVRGAHLLVGPLADVYGLGALLYHALTGRPPFRGPNAIAILHEVLESDPAPPSSVERNVPADLDAIVSCSLRKDPSARYRDAAALADDLERFVRGDPVAARRASALQRLSAWWRSHAVARVALTALLCTALAALAMYFWSYARWVAAGRPLEDSALFRFLREIVELGYLLYVPCSWGVLKVGHFKRRRQMHGEAQDPRRLKRYLWLGLATVLVGLVVAGFCIELVVWTHSLPWLSAGLSIASVGYGCALLHFAWDEWRARLRFEPIELTPADMEQIRARMAAGDEGGAMRIYRQRTHASTEECRHGVRTIAGAAR